MSACEDATAANDALNAALAGPAMVQSDAGTVEQHRLDRLVDAVKFQEARCAVTRKTRGLFLTKLIPGGTP